MTHDGATAHTVLVGAKSRVTLIPGPTLTMDDLDQRAGMTAALEAVVLERERQIEKGYGPEHDDRHDDGSLAQGAAAYALAAIADKAPPIDGIDLWPYERQYWSGEGVPRDLLVKAAAMLLAEIERIDRENKAAAFIDSKALAADDDSIPF